MLGKRPVSNRQKENPMRCPHCQNAFAKKPAKSDVLFDLCPRCGTIWLDFGSLRPKLYRQVEAQVERWERDRLAQRQVV